MPTTTSLIAERYRLLRIVGRGGMGEVWLAEDVLLGRQVAAKRIGARDASERDLARARQEARVTAMLDHEHVVRVFDLVVEDGEQWLVMELVESENLARLVRRTGPLDPTTAARMALQAAKGLAAAHGSGIVHRDVKPSNLLVTPEWHVKLSDFGIARLEGDVGTTRTGQLVGSPGYLAPEVGVGRSASPASDMWSLGATLFHALEGHPPYRTEDGNVLGTLYRIVNEPPPPMTRAGWLEPLVLHLMVHDPAERWTAEQVAAYLEEALKTAPAAPDRPAPVRRTAAASGAPAIAAQRTASAVPPLGADDGATTRLPAVTAAPPRPEQPVAADRRVVAAQHRTQRARRRSPGWLLIGALAAAVVLLVAAVVGLSQRPGSRTVLADPRPSASPSGRASATPRATAAGIQSFIRSYLSTAPADPEQAYALLTPAFQRASGDLRGYEGFWGTIASATPTRIDADPRALTVDYDVAYRLDNGSSNTDNVSLRLTMDDGKYLIAGEVG